MKKVYLTASLLFLFLLLLPGQTCASYWFRVIDVSPVNLTPNSQANFTVDVKGLGSQGAYVELVFRNVSQGLEFSTEKRIKYVFPAGVTRYNCTVKAGDVAPGNYSYVVDVSAKSSPSGKMTGFVEIMAEQADQTVQADASKPEEGQTSTLPLPKKAPAPGAALALVSLFLASWRMNR